MNNIIKSSIILVVFIIGLAWGSDIVDPSGRRRVARSAFQKEQEFKTWNASRIPYIIYPETPNFAVRKIQISLEMLMKRTCLVFTKLYDEKQFIGFGYQESGACFVSRIGMDVYGATNITLSSRCLAVDSILHYVFHALGFHHEQNRPDAGKNLKVNADSMRKMIWKGAIIRLLPYPHGYKETETPDLIPNMIGPFDYKSIMLRDDVARARKHARTPVLINVQNTDMRVGGFDGPTKIDYIKINFFFKCRGTTVKRGTKPGQWGSWGDWTPKYCPVRCGIGFQQRFRWCNNDNGTHCQGISTQSRQCDDCAGENCRNLGGDRFCKAFANCNREYHVVYCRKFCKYCGQETKNKKSDYYCFRFASPHCKEKWAQNDCPITCPKVKKTQRTGITQD